MHETTRVGIFVGSLRKESFTRKVANALVAIAPRELECEFIDISDLPHYNQDHDDTGVIPHQWRRFRKQTSELAAVLLATPEYNRSIPGVLKNALDVGSRPYGKNVWAGKPAAVIGVSPGALGAFGAVHHIRQTLVFLDMPAMQQPEAYISSAARLFDASGRLINDDTRKFLTNFMKAFAHFVQSHVHDHEHAGTA